MNTTTRDRPTRSHVTLNIRSDVLAAWRRLVPTGERSGQIERMIETSIATAGARAEIAQGEVPS